MEKFKKSINNQIRSILNIDIRWDSPRIDGKKRLTEKITNQTMYLMKEFYPVYANYFVKYIQQMKLKGITIDAVTIQNEPMNPNNNPSLKMEAVEQAEFIKNHLGTITMMKIQKKLIMKQFMI